jgi:hypothetical protein
MQRQRTPLDACNSFDPATLKILTRAFDEAWPSVASRCRGYLNMQAKRERLACVVLELAKDGERDVQTLKTAALEMFNRREQSELFPPKRG